MPDTVQVTRRPPVQAARSSRDLKRKAGGPEPAEAARPPSGSPLKRTKHVAARTPVAARPPARSRFADSERSAALQVHPPPTSQMCYGSPVSRGPDRYQKGPTTHVSGTFVQLSGLNDVDRLLAGCSAWALPYQIWCMCQACARSQG